MGNELDKELVQQLQGQFLDESQDLFASVESSLMELEKSGGAENLKTLFRNLHSIKGSSKAVGFEALSAFAHQLETRISSSQPKIDFNFLFQALDSMVEHVKLLRQNRITEANQLLKFKKN